MDAIEKAIRNAFEKGDADDRSFREKVYRSAFGALDRAMQGHPNLTVENAIQRRKNLQAKIAGIESEFVPAVASAPEPLAAEAPSVDLADAVPVREAPAVDAAAPAVGPQVEAPRLDAPSAPARANDPSPSLDVALERDAPPLSVDRAAEAEVAPDHDPMRAERRRPGALIFVLVTVLAVAAIGGWWAYGTGLFGRADDITLPPPQQVPEEEDFSPGPDGADAGPALPGQGDDTRNWITVFSPSDPSVVNAPGGATAQVGEDESGSYLRIRSGEGGAAIVIDVGQGILDRVVNRTAVFDIVARAEGGQETEMSVECSFGELGDCGRKRYNVGYERGEFLFEVTFPNRRPGAGGSISINSDFAGQGRAVDIYEIRVSVSP